MTAATALVPRQTVTELVRVYEQAERDIRAAFATLAATEKSLTAAFGNPARATGSVRILMYDRGWGVAYNRPEIALDALAKEIWQRLAQRLELQRFMTVTRWEKMKKQIEEGDMPPINVESILAFANGMRGQIPKMADEMIEEAFNYLRPRRETYKTNRRYEIGPKVIIENVIEYCGFNDDYRVNYEYGSNRLTALENVFSALDGKGRVNKTHTSKLQEAILANRETGVGETEYFAFKCFKKGTIHLRFKRLDLLAEFNRRAGGMRLREGAS